MRTLIFVIFSILPLISCSNPNVDKITLPPDFSMNIYAKDVPGARQMTLGDKGTLFVGTRGDKVYAILPNATHTKAAKLKVIAKGLNMPNGVAYRDGSLYVAEVSQVLRYDNIEEQLSTPPKPHIVNNQFPSDSHHGWKYIAFGPDGKLYVPVGTPCNACLKKDPRYASILRMNSDGSDLEFFARGVRNTVGFAWDPQTKEMWFTNNGRDWMGDDIPPEGKKVELIQKIKFTPPVLELPAHVAALGMTFYTGNMFPKEFHNQIFIAEHGSWNRSKKVGYQVIVVKREGNKVISVKPFATGWLQGQKAWGRPVDVLQMPDGALLVSDDKAGVIYRITYKKPGTDNK